MSESRPPDPARTASPAASWLAIGSIALAAASVGLLIENRATVGALRGELDRLRESATATTQELRLLRLEQASGAGTGMNALLDRLRYWAPKLQSTADAVEAPRIRERLEQILVAMRAPSIGDDAFPALVAAFRDGEIQKDAELRKWILRGMVEVDEARATEFLADLLELDVTASPRIRLIAADELTKLDKARAGRLLRKILERESHQGPSLDRLPVSDHEKYVRAFQQMGRHPGFMNFVSRYVQTGDPEIEATLIMVLGRQEHDVITMQECIKELGRMGSRRAAGKIQDMFAQPPRPQGSTLFRRHCAQAVVDILGREACDWLRAMLRKERDEMVLAQLRELIKQTCS